MIKSRQNKKIKELFKLLQKKHRDESKTFLVFGEHAITEAIKTGNVIQIYTVNSDEEGTLISKELMNELTPLKSPTTRAAIVKKNAIKPYSEKVLIIDGIQDPGNLGALIRTAVGFNFTTIIASNDSADYYNDKTISATQGSLFYANLIRTDLKKELRKLKSDGYTLLLADVDKGKKPKEIYTSGKIGLILGSEGTGVTKEIKSYADEFVKIQTTIESLNVATAGAIIMYEMSDLND